MTWFHVESINSPSTEGTPLHWGCVGDPATTGLSNHGSRATCRSTPLPLDFGGDSTVLCYRAVPLPCIISRHPVLDQEVKTVGDFLERSSL